jgi:bifunctional DNA-binding transcriptional regulator/antitoxin component of YhaV-PrlF toxin-antitoxin module
MNTGVAVVGERYHIVIEPKVRERLRIRPGDRAVEIVKGDRLIVTFVPARHWRSLRGRLAGRGRIDDFATYRDADLPRAVSRPDDGEPTAR